MFAINFAKRVLDDILSSPLNMLLVGLIFYFSYKLFAKDKNNKSASTSEPKILPKMKKRDLTLEELKEFNGSNKDGRILIAVLGKVFDVTCAQQFYGLGGPYACLAGHDASRALATFSIDDSAFRNEYDDLSDLTQSQRDSVNEWAMQFMEKYDVVGRLLKPGEEPTNYEEESQLSSSNENGTINKRLKV